jgi:hypothetical protein
MAIIVPIVSSWNPAGLNKAIVDIKRAEGSLNKLSLASGLLSANLIRTGKSLTANLTVPLLALGYAVNKTVQDASNLNETITKTNAIFGESAKDLRVWGKNAATALGMSERAALDSAGTFGLFGKVAGLSGREVSDFAQRYTGLAADFASFYNTSPQDAIVAIGAALRGESEPIRRYNILLDEMTIKNRAVSMGLIATTTEALTPQQKVLARSAEIMAQSTVAQGDFAKTSGGLANQQRILAAETANLSSTFGAVFLPVALNLVGVIRNSVLPIVQKVIAAFQTLSPEVKSTALIISLFAIALGPAMVMVGYMTKALGKLADAFLFVLKRAFIIPTVILFIIAAIVKGNDATMSWGDAVFKVVRGIVIGFVQVGNAVSWAVNLVIKAYNKFQEVIGSTVRVTEFGNFDFLIRAVDSAKSSVGKFATELSATQQDMSAIAAEAKALASDIAGGGTTAGGGGSVASATDKASEAMDKFKEKLDSAKQSLSDAKQKFVDFSKSISDSVKSVIDFGSAATAETGSFLENLISQADKAKEFASKVARLIELGLNESALTQVLDAGADAGIKIADEIIAGGATVVNQVNEILSATQSLAEQVGEYGADAFYSAGVKQGQALVDGVISAIRAAGFSVDENGNIVNPLASSAISATTGTQTATTATTAGGTTGGGSTKTPVVSAKTQGVLNKLARIPMMAAGGVVNSPTLAMIGEAGPEAVIPLNRSNAMGTTYNLTVNAGMGADGAQIGKQIVDAIKRYERSSGPVFASV